MTRTAAQSIGSLPVALKPSSSMPASSMEEAVDEGHSTPISLHRARWLAMALLLLLYVGGDTCTTCIAVLVCVLIV
jgi:hypothetical protein